MLVDGARCSGSLFDFGLYLFHCAKLVRGAAGCAEPEGLLK
jgi:hypothetical protein